jgi:conjugal transfer pilus assembly protein TraB
MSDKNFSSSNKDISIQGAKKAKVNPKDLLGSMTKDVKKRWMVVGGISAAVIMALATWMSSGHETQGPVAKVTNVVDTSPKGLSSQKDWKAQTGAEMLELKKTLTESQAAQRELLARVEALSKDMQTQGKQAAQQTTPNPGMNLTLPPPPTPPASLIPQAPSPTGTPGIAPAPAAATAKPAPVEPMAPVKRAPARSFIPTVAGADASGAADRVVEEMVPNERQGFLPAGSFAASTLISGVEAFTGGTAQQQPQPLVIRVDANAVLPNAANYQIKGCHVLASAWGDMSSERVFGRLATLTCVDSANRLVLSEEVEGVLVDSDGKNGIRGSLQDRQGAKLARSLLAGFAEGVSSAFGAAQQTTQTTAVGMTTALLGKNATKAGAYNGASTAAEQLADFYMKQAEATMPVIAIDAGRKISVLFTKSKALKFETTNTYRVQPKDRMMVERPGN